MVPREGSRVAIGEGHLAAGRTGEVVRILAFDEIGIQLDRPFLGRDSDSPAEFTPYVVAFTHQLHRPIALPCSICGIRHGDRPICECGECLHRVSRHESWRHGHTTKWNGHFPQPPLPVTHDEAVSGLKAILDDLAKEKI